jgi:CDP-paratose 2-epimerase
MKILITGGCGFVGSNIAIYLKKKILNAKIDTLDNLSRVGSIMSYQRLKKYNINNYKYNVSDFSKIKKIPKYDLIIDCCAEPAVEVSKSEVDRVFNTNLIGTFNLLKKCAENKSNLIFLSSSRVYAIDLLKKTSGKLKKNIKKKILYKKQLSTDGPKSIYGYTKFASEELIKEYSYLFNIKYIINRLSVISGPWQFGKQDQGFVSWWIWQHLNKKKLNYIGFGGSGYQIRDVIHIYDVCKLIYKQIKLFPKKNNLLLNVGGGVKNAISLKELTKKCEKITSNSIKLSAKKSTSIYDIPYFITDNSKVSTLYRWKPEKSIDDIIKDVHLWMKLNFNRLKTYIK